MKHFKILLLAIILLPLFATAQGGKFKEKKEQIKTLKIAFITGELSLTTTEAEKFWPLYNAFDEKQHQLRQQKFISRLGNGSVEQMNEKEATVFLSQIENNEEELYQLRKKFISNLKSILPSVKIIKLKKAEDDFNRKLLKQYRDKRK